MVSGKGSLPVVSGSQPALVPARRRKPLIRGFPVPNGVSRLWPQILERFSDSPAKLRVVKQMIELGLSVGQDGGIYCGPVEITPTKLAKAVGVDRRVVAEAVEMIRGDQGLISVFSLLRPAGLSMRGVAKQLGLGVVEIYADPRAVGIVAKAATIVSSRGISIRQIVADDPELHPEPRLTIVTERELPGTIIPELLKIPYVKSVSVY